jgi:flagellar FliJ protein
MKRFKFRLQRILDIREQIRDEARQELAVRNQVLAEQVSILRGLHEELLRLDLQPNGILSAGELVLTGAYSERVKQLITRQMVRVEEAKAAVEQAREHYIQANKDAKALEMLKDKKRDLYNEEVLKEESNQLDELAVQRAGAKR